MLQSNIDILEKHYHHWITLKNAKYLRGLNANEKNELLAVMQAEFSPKYNTDLWCGNCVANMVRDLYQRYDDYKRKQGELNTLPPAPLIEPPLIELRVNAKTDAILCTLTGADFITALPALQEAKRLYGDVVFVIEDSVKEYADLARLNYFLQSEDKYKASLEIKYTVNPGDNVYESLNLPKPLTPVKAELFTRVENVPQADYVLDFKKATPVIKSMPFNVFVSLRQAEGCTLFNGNVNTLVNTLLRSKYGVVTDNVETAALAWHLGVNIFALKSSLQTIDENIKVISGKDIKKFISE